MSYIYRHSKSGSRKWQSEIKCLQPMPPVESLQKQGSQRKVKFLTWWFYELPSNTEVWVSKDQILAASLLYADLTINELQRCSWSMHFTTLSLNTSWKCPWQSITQPNWENGLNVSSSLYLKIANREWKYYIRNAICSLPNQLVQGNSVGCVKTISSHG